MELRVIFIVLLCFIGGCMAQTQSEGSTCQDGKSGKSGVCLNINSCPSALESLKRQVFPQICEFKGTVPIVCCPNQQTVITDRNRVGVIAKQKCKEYAKFAYTYYPSPLTTGPRNLSRLDCGFKIIPLIVGGEKAKGKEFPHSAAIGYDTPNGKVYHCGGSLISENFVLSAGHCQNSQEHGLAKSVRLGDLNLETSNDDADPQEYSIAEFVRHPDYRPPSHYNDILLIRLSQNVRFTKYVRPTCLYTGMGQQLSSAAIASGWGKISHSSDKTNDHLLKVVLNFASHQECFSSFQKNKHKLKDGIVESSQICAGSRTELKDTCEGDSGGPLQIFNLEEECMYLQVGVTSFGKICGITNSPAVYTRVSNYIGWIEKNVWPNSN